MSVSGRSRLIVFSLGFIARSLLFQLLGIVGALAVARIFMEEDDRCEYLALLRRPVVGLVVFVL